MSTEPDLPDVAKDQVEVGTQAAESLPARRERTVRTFVAGLGAGTVAAFLIGLSDQAAPIFTVVGVTIVALIAAAAADARQVVRSMPSGSISRRSSTPPPSNSGLTSKRRLRANLHSLRTIAP